MRKKISLAGIVLLMALLLMMPGCKLLEQFESRAVGTNPTTPRELSVYTGMRGEVDESLVGIWFWDDNSGFEYLFNDDGTGVRGWPGEALPFSWYTIGSTLFLECQGDDTLFGIRNERWTFDVTGYVLSLTSQQSRNMSYVYIRDGNLGDVVQELIGTWYWDESIFWTYNFYEDGTGFGGWAFDEFEILWGVTGNRLRIEYLGQLPKYTSRIYTWGFYIEDGLLHLTDTDGETTSYYMDDRSWDVDPALVDTWAWDEYTNWRYVFNEDGTVQQGPYYDYFAFTWGTYDNELRFFYEGIVFDSWFYTVTGSRLRLESRYDSYTVFYYIQFDSLDDASQESQNSAA